MFTVCPKCTLTLAVTASDLRMGQGYVRCGRCANVFNALLTLSQEPLEDTNGASAPTPADRASSSQIQAALRDDASEASEASEASMPVSEMHSQAEPAGGPLL
ncbi:MAG TPA: MJ0042-type zinc finger domain-containing protein, partial [Steroidobacteraceae bacterium]